MLVKLLKYEFKDTARVIPILYLCVAVMAVLTFIARQTGVTSFLNTTGVFLIFAAIALYIVTVILLIMRYYKSLYGNEGYLMFTIPVKPHLLLASKSIIAVLWMALSGIVSAGAAFLSAYLLGGGLDIHGIWLELQKYNLTNLIYLFIPMLLLSIVWFISQVFFAITLSNLSIFHRMGFGAAILIYIVMYFVFQIIQVIFTLLIPISIHVGESGVSLAFDNMWSFIKSNISGAIVNEVPIGLGAYIFVFIMTCVLFYINGRLMNRKVSLK